MKAKTILQSLISLLSLWVASAGAQTIDLNVNNDAVALDYTTRISQSELNLGAGLLHHQDHGDVYYGSLFVADNVNKQTALLAGIGSRAYYLDGDESDQSGTAVSLGGFVNWEIPTVTNLSLRTDIYYAPDVLAFDEIEGYLDFSARIQYRIIEQAWVYLGYRNAEAQVEAPGKAKLDEGGHVGIMLWF
ncbi:MAG: YfaZ family outer membrane protein [Pseudomonadota bacterium]|nr:YfaZ family outer membrane protein [Pseudomonadota bacterium]